MQYEFEPKRRKWDRFKSFYNDTGFSENLVVFETGQAALLTTRGSFRGRTTVNNGRVELLSSADAEMPVVYLDQERKEKCAKAWLNHQGSQQFCWDKDAREIVATASLGSGQLLAPRELRKVPPPQEATGLWASDVFSRAKVLWPASGHPPDSRFGIWVNRPDKLYISTVAPKLRRLKAPLLAAARLRGISPASYDAKLMPREQWMNMTDAQIAEDIKSNEQTFRLALNGYETYRQNLIVRRLYTK